MEMQTTASVSVSTSPTLMRRSKPVVILRDYYQHTNSSAAVSWPNGTSIGVATVEGTTEYRDMMRRLSLPESQHFAPPYGDGGEAMRDYPRQQLRKLRKRAGLPASTEAGIIGDMIIRLRLAVEASLGKRIDTAASSFPKLIALYEEEVWDGFEWAGLEHMQVLPWYGMTYQLMSNYAQQGFGLCSDYKHPDDCEKELQDVPHVLLNSILNVIYSREGLLVEWPKLTNAYYWYIQPYRTFEDFALGSNAEATTPEYWQVLQDRLLGWFQSQYYFWEGAPPSKVFVTGESAWKEEFKSALREACSFIENDPVYFDDDILYSGAKGTAELAKRANWLNPQNEEPVWRGW
jgi:hypothetical protein